MATKTHNKLVPVEGLAQAAECLRTLAHPHRLRMIEMLLQDRYTVGQLADACGIASHVASEHLGRMKDRGLLTSERDGRCIYYQVAETGLSGIMACIRKRFGSSDSSE